MHKDNVLSSVSMHVISVIVRCTAIGLPSHNRNCNDQAGMRFCTIKSHFLLVSYHLIYFMYYSLQYQLCSFVFKYLILWMSVTLTATILIWLILVVSYGHAMWEANPMQCILTSYRFVLVRKLKFLTWTSSIYMLQKLFFDTIFQYITMGMNHLNITFSASSSSVTDQSSQNLVSVFSFGCVSEVMHLSSVKTP